MNTEDYLGIPFEHGGRDRDGIDCYGLALLVLGEQHGIEPRDYRYADSTDSREATILDTMHETEWNRLDNGPGEIGDIGYLPPAHLVVYAGNGKVLHADDKSGEVVGMRLHMVKNRVAGWWRHEAMM